MIIIFYLFPQSKEVGVQLQEDLIKVLNELYTVRKSLNGMFCINGESPVLISGLEVCPHSWYMY